MAEIREAFMAGDEHYEIRLQSGQWYELWHDKSIIGARDEWPVDPETEEPFVASKFVQMVMQMCIELDNETHMADYSALA
jgi:hypothetical protein